MHDGRSTSTKQQTKMYITRSSKIKHLNLSNMKSLYTYFQIIFLVLKFWITLKELIFFSAWEFLCPNIINLKKTNFQLQNIFLWFNKLWTSTWFLLTIYRKMKHSYNWNNGTVYNNPWKLSQKNTNNKNKQTL